MGYKVRGYIMKQKLILITLVCSLFGCGSQDTVSFDGVWEGSYTSNQNNCPFSVRSDINPLFPMTVSTDVNDVFTVVAVDGSTAIGGQGSGEVISFIASAPTFGSYGSIAPYSCASTLSTVGFLDAGADKAAEYADAEVDEVTTMMLLLKTTMLMLTVLTFEHFF